MSYFVALPPARLLMFSAVTCILRQGSRSVRLPSWPSWCSAQAESPTGTPGHPGDAVLGGGLCSLKNSGSPHLLLRHRRRQPPHSRPVHHLPLPEEDVRRSDNSGSCTIAGGGSLWMSYYSTQSIDERTRNECISAVDVAFYRLTAGSGHII